MNIKLNEKYKSLLTNIDITLPNFTIISGINGAGKSHFLSAISQNIVVVTDEHGNEINPKRYVNSGSLTPNESYQIGRENLTSEISAAWYTIQNYHQQKITNPHLTIEQHLQKNIFHANVLYRVLYLSEKDAIQELTLEDIGEYYPIDQVQDIDIFHQNFSTIFKRYFDKQDDNYYNQYLNDNKKIKKRYLTEGNFLKRYGPPPWEFVNRIFEEADIGYSISHPLEGNRDVPFHFKLVNKINGVNVNFNDLSSGEKVLMSLTLALYNAKQNIAFPSLLLLDEPDAPLHPSMAKKLLDVIQNVFVDERGVRVIMTTHSPSTIAMAPEDALYVMQKEEPRIEKRSKEQIMKLLTFGIPSFSIYTDSTRQVFVESEYDEYFYKKVYLKLKKDYRSDKSLNFISSGLTKNDSGNCDQVKLLVNRLTKNGNQTIYGIIDWDKRNNGNDKIHVLGLNQRYSLENYIFDPLILANFLLREAIVDNSYFNLEENEISSDFKRFSQNKLQNVADIVLGDISKAIRPTDSAKKVVKYYGELAIDIPIWFLHHDGHELLKKIKEIYKPLESYKKLIHNVIDKVINENPEFISMDIFNLLQDLHD
ncbi:ATP-binding protein [Persicitalea jodogahamensis]|uniref:AAA+ ATPase domain-containing protein n=1 Tax=Persicitalea jodogahamensis TaxID=402147 RepID=A0A8J3G8G9_9BACT|nr:ATP-binding protein [Persicitalea jodogahamensis]GHB65632.1 hypothetical protein GCM10007390_19690 [Persicitalea jodogahamensis]